MATWHSQIPPSSVVVLLPVLDDSAPPPAELPIAARPPAAVRVLLVLLAVLAGLGAFGGVALLWINDTPIWFTLIFTVMGAIFGLGLIALVTDWHATAREEERAKERWRSNPPMFAHGGTVVDREVTLTSESGSVSQIALQVQVAGETIPARWRSRSGATVLQSQVPGVGSRARVWRSNAGPTLVEVADPSVIRTEDAL